MKTLEKVQVISYKYISEGAAAREVEQYMPWRVRIISTQQNFVQRRILPLMS